MALGHYPAAQDLAPSRLFTQVASCCGRSQHVIETPGLVATLESTVTETESRAQPDPQIAIQSYQLLVETYQQHVDLMLKCVAIYLAVVGTVTGLVFSANADPQRRIALCVFVALTSLITIVGGPAAFAWVRGLEGPMRRYEQMLRLDRFPLGGVRYIIWATLGIALLILAGSVITAMVTAV